MCLTCGCGKIDEILISKPKRISKSNLIFDKKNQSVQVISKLNDNDHTHNISNKKNEKIIDLEQDILYHNNNLAEENRLYFKSKNIFTINMVSSPGSGKTSLIETTIKDIKDDILIEIIEGDQQTFNDANRIEALHIPVVQINTGKGCHLDSKMIKNALKPLNPAEFSLLIIENVGNLVCPALFDLGENKRVVIISVTEGDDKPIKYPDMFISAQICIINKVDLLPYVKFDVAKAKEYARKVNPELIFFEVSTTTGTGMEDWYQWLKNEIKLINLSST